MGCFNSRQPEGGESPDHETRTPSPAPVLPSRPLLPLPVEPQQQNVIALWDYVTNNPADLPFHKGDLLQVLDRRNGHAWWKARLVRTGREGEVPATYLSEDTEFSQAWYHGNISKRTAIRMLMASQMGNGAFLIRVSQTNPKCHALSLLISLPELIEVRHYLIHPLDNTAGYYIHAKSIFQSLAFLVDHYSANDELCCRLTVPVPISQPFAELDDKWQLERTEITLTTTELGSGHFGSVFEGLYMRAKVVAVKQMKPGTMAPEKFLEEAENMKNLRHKNIVALFGICSEREPVLIVTELMPLGDLLGLLQSVQGSELTVNQLILMAGEVASGMAYLEEQRYVHRDLRAQNILVGDKLVCKVADFGLCRYVRGNFINEDGDEIYQARSNAKFPIKWTAPEAANYGLFTYKSDVWSFGILCFEVITRGRKPYPFMNSGEVLTEIEKGYRMPMPRGCPEPLYNMMTQCWLDDAKRRPTFAFLQSFLDDYPSSMESGYM